MAKLKFKNSKGEWESIAAFQGEPGKDGAIQYIAGEGIKIEDNIISAEGNGGELDSVYVADIPEFYHGASSTTEVLKTKFGEVLSKIRQDGCKYPILIIKGANATQLYYYKGTAFPNNDLSFGSSLITNNENPLDGRQGTTYIISYSLKIQGQWNNDIFTPSFINAKKGDAGVLPVNNTYAYTPTGNYHPATKKYVDDSIKTAITDALGGSY